MGKREILIVVGFLVVGVLVYQLAAPAPREGERGFSLTGMFAGIRRQIGANAASATVTRTGTVAVAADLTELRVSTMRRVPIIITGERRSDISYEFQVQSTGPDEATARAYAERTGLREDDLGTALALVTTFPREGTQTARLVLTVPERLTVRIEGSSQIEVTGVGGLSLHNTAGEVTAKAILGAVTGSHRSGEVVVSGAGVIEINLTATRARFDGITRSVTFNARTGSVKIASSAGPVEAVATSADVTIDGHDGRLNMTGEGGAVQVTQPRGEISIDVRRMLVELTLDQAVPVSVLTTDEPIRLTLDGVRGLMLDALATDGGQIRAPDLGIEVASTDAGPRLAGALGGGGPRVVLRNARSSIVIGPRK